MPPLVRCPHTPQVVTISDFGEDAATLADTHQSTPGSAGASTKPLNPSPESGRGAMPLWKKIMQRLALLVLVGAACAALVFPLNQMTSERNRTLDFAAFYTAGRILHAGQAKRLYEVGLQQEVERKASPGGPFLPYYHPPFEAPLFLAFAVFSYPHAFLLWAALNLVVIGLIVFLLRSTGHWLGSGAYLLWMVLLLFFVLATLGLGQDTLLVALVLLLAYMALKKRREYLAGIVLGLGLFRFEVLLPFVFIFFLRRRWKLLTGFSAVGIVSLLVSAALVGWKGFLVYVKTLVEVGGTTAASSWADRSSAAMMPSLRGAFDALLRGVVPRSLLFPVILVGTLLLLGWAAWELRHSDHPDDSAFDLEFSFAVVAALLASYHLFISELAPLIIIGFLILAYEGARSRKGILGNRWGTALLWLFLGVVAVGALLHSQTFSVEVALLLALLVWLSRELAVRRKTAPRG